jgi:hypothetical protein
VKSVVLMQQTSLLALPTPQATSKGNRVVPAFTPALGKPIVDQVTLEKALQVLVDGIPDSLKGVRTEDGRVIVNDLTATLVSRFSFLFVPGNLADCSVLSNSSLEQQR